MGGMVRSCMQWLLKLLNSVTAMFGMAMILYALWMLKAWQRHLGPPPIPADDPPIPWFICTFFGLGITFCVITCSGHIAAENANGFCLSCYMFFLFFLIMLEGAVTVDVFLNHNWEEDFPKDQSGRFDEVKEFVRSNFDICKWIGLSLLSVQGLSILLALILKALGPHHRYDDSDDDYSPSRVSLLKKSIADPVYGSKNDAWNLLLMAPIVRGLFSE